MDMVREGSEAGYLPNRGDFRRELEVSPRTLVRNLDVLRDEERAGQERVAEDFDIPKARTKFFSKSDITGGINDLR